VTPESRGKAPPPAPIAILDLTDSKAFTLASIRRAPCMYRDTRDQRGNLKSEDEK